ncbi:hypothetical protein ACCO45_003248 [Purpureocillium lilacinum]|uniref:Uncharacterized protein n=1 Tax=Purpureocillium lilacinum TaxID=33203 RepID=A0ACC4DZA3_PURLI
MQRPAPTQPTLPYPAILPAVAAPTGDSVTATPSGEPAMHTHLVLAGAKRDGRRLCTSSGCSKGPGEAPFWKPTVALVVGRRTREVPSWPEVAPRSNSEKRTSSVRRDAYCAARVRRDGRGPASGGNDGAIAAAAAATAAGAGRHV